VLIPIGLPGMGKSKLFETYLHKFMHEEDPEMVVVSISNDQIRNQLIKQWLSDAKGGTIEEAIKATSR
jgi:hypothetical protein